MELVDCNHRVAFVLLVSLEAFADAVVLPVASAVTVVLLASTLAPLLDPEPLPAPPLPLPFPTPTPSPTTPAAPSVDFFPFLGFLQTVLIFTFVSVEEASVHCLGEVYKNYQKKRPKESEQELKHCKCDIYRTYDLVQRQKDIPGMLFGLAFRIHLQVSFGIICGGGSLDSTSVARSDQRRTTHVMYQRCNDDNYEQ